MKKGKYLLLVLVTAILAISATGCGVLSENLAIKKTEAKKKSITITFDAVTSANYDTYELREYGVAYSTKSSYLSGQDSSASSLTPKQNYPRAKIKSISKQPSIKYGKRQLVTLTVTIKNLKPGTTYYFKPYVYGSYYETDKEINTSYGYGSLGNLTTLKTSSGNSKGNSVKLAKVSGMYATGAKKKAILSWRPVSKATGYEVYVSKTKKGRYKKIKKTKALYYTHKKLKPRTKYYYKVRAYNNKKGTSYGPFSKIVSAKVKK